jgi:hypothetical protein
MDLYITSLAVVEEICGWEKACNRLNSAGNAVHRVFGIWIAFISRGT